MRRAKLQSKKTFTLNKLFFSLLIRAIAILLFFLIIIIGLYGINAWEKLSTLDWGFSLNLLIATVALSYIAQMLWNRLSK